MKITIEIPDFDIIPNNDGSMMSFREELRNEIIQLAAQHIYNRQIKEIEEMSKKCEILVIEKRVELRNMVESTTNSISDIFKKECNEIINEIKQRNA